MDTTARGLSKTEAQARIHVYGNNTIQSKKSFHPVRSFAKQLVNLMAIMLWAASILALNFWDASIELCDLVYYYH